MNLICPRCHTSNESDAHFCRICGTGFNVKPIRRNSIAAPVVIIVAILIVCVFCGIFGLISSNKKEVAQSTTTISPARPLMSAKNSNSLLNSDSAEPVQLVKPGRSATVIAENANLRQTPSSGGEIVQALPQDARVEIVRQQGAWFYVKAGGQNGWMHGNTIRLDNDNQIKEKQSASTQTYATPKIMRPAPEPEINNSGATAKCQDGTLSYSAHRRGTCSHHGGVAVWY